jgi:hypothetical protein
MRAQQLLVLGNRDAALLWAERVAFDQRLPRLAARLAARVGLRGLDAVGDRDCRHSNPGRKAAGDRGERKKARARIALIAEIEGWSPAGGVRAGRVISVTAVWLSLKMPEVPVPWIGFALACSKIALSTESHSGSACAADSPAAISAAARNDIRMAPPSETVPSKPQSGTADNAAPSPNQKGGPKAALAP